MPNLSIMKDFINNLFDYEDQNFTIELRLIGNNGMVNSKFFTLGEISTPQFDLFINSNLEKNIYFGVLPREEKSGKAEDVKFGKVLWADYDIHDISWSEDVIVSQLGFVLDKMSNAIIPAPTYTVFTGKGLSFFWKLNETLDPKTMKIYQEALTSKLSKLSPNFDLRVKDISRIMRLPGSENVKYGKPIGTIILGKDRGICYKDFIDINEVKVAERVTIDIENIKMDRWIDPSTRDDIVNFFSEFWVPSYRHELQKYLVGLFIKNGIKSDHAQNIIKRICEKAKDEEETSRLSNVRYQYSNRLNVNLSGSHGIRKTIWEMITKYELPQAEGFVRLEAEREKYKNNKLLESDISGIIVYKLSQWKLRENIFQEDDTEVVLDLNDLLNSESKPVDYLINPLIPKGKLIMIAGKPSSMKSLIAFTMGICIATGQELFGHKIDQARVAYLDAENDENAIKIRSKYIMKGLGISDVLSIKNNFHWRSANITDLSRLKKICDSYDVIIIDSYRRFLKGDEKDSVIVDMFYKEFLKPLRDKGKTIILIHHYKKKDPKADLDPMEMIRGSSDISAQLDLAFGLNKGDELNEEDAKRMQCDLEIIKIKNRLGLPINDFSLRITKDDKKEMTTFERLGFKKIISLEDQIKELIIKNVEDYEIHYTRDVTSFVRDNLSTEVSARYVAEIISKMINRGTITRLQKGQIQLEQEQMSLKKDDDGSFKRTGDE